MPAYYFLTKAQCIQNCLPLTSHTVSHPIRPKAPSATSIPAILKSLQDEWVRDSFLLFWGIDTTGLTHYLIICFNDFSGSPHAVW